MLSPILFAGVVFAGLILSGKRKHRQPSSSLIKSKQYFQLMLFNATRAWREIKIVKLKVKWIQKLVSDKRVPVDTFTNWIDTFNYLNGPTRIPSSSFMLI